MYLRTADHRQLFLKYNKANPGTEMFRLEALGLALLGASRSIAVPKVFKHQPIEGEWAFLLLEYIEPGYRNRLFWEVFGQSLSNLHGNTSAQFGFSHNNFLGTLPQSNTRHTTWAEFYATERLLPQLKMAQDTGRLDRNDAMRINTLCRSLGSICPEEPPALIHGDLWSGNFLCNLDGQPVLIDPAASFSHREMDLAMSRLFGGFDAAFYLSYDANFPLEPGLEERLPVYQLYYLLAHVNLFGGGYVEQVRGILKRW
ncbi:MAG: fructosamine kinase family protein [Lewinellaceae bacterium]|nr:fructosamine kinase family protein [Lewinellaceae bacterium]